MKITHELCIPFYFQSQVQFLNFDILLKNNRKKREDRKGTDFPRFQILSLYIEYHHSFEKSVYNKIWRLCSGPWICRKSSDYQKRLKLVEEQLRKISPTLV